MSDNDNLINGVPETKVWEEYRKTGNRKLRDDLIKQYAPLVKYVAGKISVGMPGSVDYDDLVGFGVFGLLDAIERFDTNKHVKFKTYAITRIRGAIFDELRAIDWVPRSVRQKAKEIEETVQRLEAKLGRVASGEDICNEMGLTSEQYNQMMMKVNSSNVISLSDLWFTGNDNEQVSIAEGIESSPSLRPDVINDKNEIRSVIIEAISELPDKEKKVLVLYYYEDLTLKEIGKVLEVTESRVSQLHGRAISRLKARLVHSKKGIF